MPNRANDPEHIAISRTKGVRIDWKDGHSSQYELQYLRDRCPCAQCTGAHGGPGRNPQPESPLQVYKPRLKMQSVEPVGNYAFRIVWSDGHSTGIYSYEHLREICPCPACQGSSAPGPAPSK
jgi:DUF971 family protein